MAPISDIQDEEKPAEVVTPDEQDSEDSIVSDRDPEPAVPEERIDVIPDGGYGWVCVACCFLINAHTWGINSVSQTSSPVTLRKTLSQLNNITVIRCFPFSLLDFQHISQRVRPRVRLYWWTLNLHVPRSLPRSNHVLTQVRDTHHAEYRHPLTNGRPPRCILCHRNMATLSSPRRCLRFRDGLPLRGHSGNNTPMVLEEAQLCKQHRRSWQWHRWSNLLISLQCNDPVYWDRVDVPHSGYCFMCGQCDLHDSYPRPQQSHWLDPTRIRFPPVQETGVLAAAWLGIL